MISVAIDPRIPILVQRLVDAVHPRQVILFGSRARGSSDPASDIDLLVVLDVCTKRHEVAARLLNLTGGIGLPVDVVVRTTAEFAERQGLPGSIESAAAREGIPLHAA